MRRPLHRLLAFLAVLGTALALSVGLQVPHPLDAREAAPQPPSMPERDRVLAELADPPGEEGAVIDSIVENPEGPPLSLEHRPTYAVTVQRGRCKEPGDAIVTLESTQDGLLEGVVRRAGDECFRVPFPEGPEGAMPVVRTMGTMKPDGTAGPLAIVEAQPVERIVRGPAVELFQEVHLSVIGWSGELLMDRALRTRTFHDGGGGGEDVRLTPLVWNGTELLVWSQARGWSRRADECVGSLLAVPLAGSIRVAEGLPCNALVAHDVDGDGRVELHAESFVEDSTYAPWSAEVSLDGDIVPQGGDDDATFRFDLDGDGSPDGVYAQAGEAVVRDASGLVLLRARGEPLAGRVDGDVRELVLRQLPCGIAAVRLGGESRCAPESTAALQTVDLAGTSFDWTGDGTPDVTFASTVTPGHTQLVAWTEGDRTFSRDLAGPESLAPLHQAPRALRLTAASDGPEVLLHTPQGFVVQSVASGENLWEAGAGVLDAWAVPTDGTTAIAPR